MPIKLKCTEKDGQEIFKNINNVTCLSGKFVDDLCHVYLFYNFPIFNSGLDPEHGCG